MKTNRLFIYKYKPDPWNKERKECYRTVWKQLEPFSEIGKVALFQDFFNKYKLEVFEKDNVRPLYLRLKII